MTEDTQLLDGMDMKIHMNGNGKVWENRDNGVSKISVVDHINGKECRNTQADCFIVDMEGISQLMEKDITANNSGITFQRNLSRKSSQRGGEKKTNLNVGNERDANFVSTSSPRALVLQGGGDKPAVVTMGTPTTEVHNQTSTMAGNGTMTTDNKISGKRLSFKRSSSSSSWSIQPRKILFFFATL
ncbi:hypothetical protein LIER_05991 [Lithospermum erythrorhizon]|uniref:Uncharacterized protein n=1 Tax=Lithospermum erythrorhizon TaxID=34254 RepID=A0AAV3P7G3_LITER